MEASHLGLGVVKSPTHEHFLVVGLYMCFHVLHGKAFLLIAEQVIDLLI